MNVKKGFTLAEVLITLSIIGVVAALTIPTLTRKFEKAEWIARYKSTYSILSQATKMIAANNNGTLAGVWYKSVGDNTADMYNAYLPYLKAMKKVENANIVENKCFSAQKTELNGYSYSMNRNGYCVVLPSGASLLFTANSSEHPTKGMLYYADIEVDVNGIKGPNVIGKDIHLFIIIDLLYGQDVNNSGRVVIPDNPPYTIEDCPDNLASGTGETCGIRIMRGDYGLDY